MKLHRYPGKDYTITFDAARCIHSEECVHGLPQVFDPAAKPWINPGSASVQETTAVVHRCPSGALHVEPTDARFTEKPDAENTISLTANGPLYCRGDIRIVAESGETLLTDMRVALCRCGASAHKPLCDNAHIGIGFTDAATPVPQELEAGGAQSGGPLTVTPHNNGPLQMTGAVRIMDAFGDTIYQGDDTWLCRCGGSQNKPFCDGTHKKIGFKG
jgi:CDGSH-type Zn-finger protein/uncharacterized Fe-S cluster protein YjdI